MMKIFSKKFYGVLINVSVVGLGITLACAGGDWFEYGSSNFTPEAFADSSYKPFFYSDAFYYEIGYDQAHDKRFNEANVKDWAGYLAHKPSEPELKYLLTTASFETIDSISSYVLGKTAALPRSVQGFEVFKNRSDKKISDFITYLVAAKKCETFSLNGLEDEWNYGPKENKKAININLLKRDLEEGLNNSSHPFLKQRYWFQTVRFHYFKSNPQTAVNYFESNEAKFPRNKLFYRGLAYAAGGYYKLKNYAKANYNFSKVYDSCPELKTVAHYSFHPQNENDWKATLALCKTNDERATLWQMLGVFYGDAKRAITEIHKLNPKSEKLDLLLTRAINIEEQKFLTGNEVWPSSPRETDKQNNEQSLLSLVGKIAESGNTNKPYLWHIAAGYLHMLEKNYNAAKSHYLKAESALPNTELIRSQLRLLKLINTLGAATRIDAKLENQVLKDIRWLHEGSHPKLRSHDALEWIKQTMANKYIRQKDLVKAECFKSNSSFYLSDKNVEAMKSFLDQPRKTAYEQLCKDLYTMQKTDLLEYQAIRLALDDKLTDAITVLETVGDGGQLPGNPFNGRILDCHDCDHAAPQKIKYTKLSLLKKMKEMQDKIAVGEDVYNNALLLAHAHYNITHFGNARFFYESKVLGSGHYSPFGIDSSYRNYLTDMKTANKYYALALKSAETDEQKARCQYMLAKCERNKWYNETFFNNSANEYGENNKGDFKAWNGFQALKQYSNTQYYKEVVRECGYFRSYLSK